MPMGSTTDTLKKFDCVEFEMTETFRYQRRTCRWSGFMNCVGLTEGLDSDRLWGSVTWSLPPPPSAVIVSQPLLCNRPSAWEINDGHLWSDGRHPLQLCNLPPTVLRRSGGKRDRRKKTNAGATGGFVIPFENEGPKCNPKLRCWSQNIFRENQNRPIGTEPFSLS